MRRVLAVPTVFSVGSTECSSERTGFRPAGTLRVTRSDRAEYSAEYFLDPEGTTVLVTADHGPVHLFSLTDTDYYLTLVAKRVPWPATPPFHHLELVGPKTDAEALETHRNRIRDVVGLKLFASIDEIADQETHHSARACAWRNAHDDRELLDLDLRAMLGPRYDALGPAVAKRMVQPVPAAKIVI